MLMKVKRLKEILQSVLIDSAIDSKCYVCMVYGECTVVLLYMLYMGLHCCMTGHSEFYLEGFCVARFLHMRNG